MLRAEPVGFARRAIALTDAETSRLGLRGDAVAPFVGR
jgi:hypothetical protein